MSKLRVEWDESMSNKIKTQAARENLSETEYIARALIVYENLQHMLQSGQQLFVKTEKNEERPVVLQKG